LRILLVSGSNRERSLTRIALKTVEARLHMLATDMTHIPIEVDFLDLFEHPLPLFNDTAGQYQIPEVIDLKIRFQRADAIMIGTPDYHSSISGVLKNSLDFLSSEEFRKKPVAILAACGGGKGGVAPLQTLRMILRALYANCIPQQVVVDSSLFKGDTCLDRGILYRIDEMCKELIDLTNIFVTAKSQTQTAG
jgi:azobenzene reductase